MLCNGNLTSYWFKIIDYFTIISLSEFFMKKQVLIVDLECETFQHAIMIIYESNEILIDVEAPSWNATGLPSRI